MAYTSVTFFTLVIPSVNHERRLSEHHPDENQCTGGKKRTASTSWAWKKGWSWKQGYIGTTISTEEEEMRGDRVEARGG